MLLRMTALLVLTLDTYYFLYFIASGVDPESWFEREIMPYLLGMGFFALPYMIDHAKTRYFSYVGIIEETIGFILLVVAPFLGLFYMIYISIFS